MVRCAPKDLPSPAGKRPGVGEPAIAQTPAQRSDPKSPLPCGLWERVAAVSCRVRAVPGPFPIPHSRFPNQFPVTARYAFTSP
jgi:hypothetical protein